MNCIVAGARVSAPDWIEKLRALQLPNLRVCLRHGVGGTPAWLPEASPCTPDEAALAHALGWQGQPEHYPWAAWENQLPGQGAAWITPCHWSLGQSHATLMPPADLALSDGDSRRLMERMAPYFEEDGIALRYDRADRWLAVGDCFKNCPSVSLARAVGQGVGEWGVVQGQSAVLQRLQSEMQMLLYQDPLNEAREAKSLLAVNALHISGSGVWVPSTTSTEGAAQPAPQRVVDLLESAQRGDLAAWLAGWQQLDQSVLAQAVQSLQQGQTVRLVWAGQESYVALDCTAAQPRQLWQFWLRQPRYPHLFLETPQSATSP